MLPTFQRNLITLHSTTKIDAAGFSTTLKPIYQTTGHYYFSCFRLCAACQCLKHLIVFLTLVTLYKSLKTLHVSVSIGHPQVLKLFIKKITDFRHSCSFVPLSSVCLFLVVFLRACDSHKHARKQENRSSIRLQATCTVFGLKYATSICGIHYRFLENTWVKRKTPFELENHEVPCHFATGTLCYSGYSTENFAPHFFIQTAVSKTAQKSCTIKSSNDVRWIFLPVNTNISGSLRTSSVIY
jgi:hypothetical protein